MQTEKIPVLLNILVNKIVLRCKVIKIKTCFISYCSFILQSLNWKILIFPVDETFNTDSQCVIFVKPAFLFCA